MLNHNLGHTRLIRETCEAHGLTIPQTAYVLAIAHWETNATMLPVKEGYYLGSRAESFRRSLRYYPWYGRGFSQLTWERNYLRASAALKVDLIANPDLALDPVIAGQVLVLGSKEGWFTGRKLADYIRPGRTDYLGARRIINGTDKAAAIADLALAYEYDLTPAPAYPALRRGARGKAVTEAQIHLTAQGYDSGLPDGVFGARTEAAVRAFQRSAGLTPDAIIGPLTWAALIPEMET